MDKIEVPPAPIISKTSTSLSRATNSLSSPGFPGLANLHSLSTPCMPKASVATSNRSPPMRATVPVADGEAGRRPYRRAVAGDFHRTEINSHNPRSTVGTITEIHDYLVFRYACRRTALSGSATQTVDDPVGSAGAGAREEAITAGGVVIDRFCATIWRSARRVV